MRRHASLPKYDIPAWAFLLKVDEIYDRWVADGMPFCTHERRDKIQDMGVPPEDYACVKCGITWDMGDDPPEPRGRR